MRRSMKSNRMAQRTPIATCIETAYKFSAKRNSDRCNTQREPAAAIVTCRINASGVDCRYLTEVRDGWIGVAEHKLQWAAGRC
jgi:hypothetical protein